MKVITGAMGATMILFVLITAIPAHRKWAKDEPNWILCLSELALFYSGLTTLLLAFQE